MMKYALSSWTSNMIEVPFLRQKSQRDLGNDINQTYKIYLKQSITKYYLFLQMVPSIKRLFHELFSIN